MHTMSTALSAAGANSYYEEGYAPARGNYYSSEGRARGRWRGEVAAEFELLDDVESEDFSRLCNGQDARTETQLVRHVTPRVRKDENGEALRNKKTGKVLVTSAHRAGWDNVFSAPKSVSIAAIIGGDERIVAAHDRAVDAALKVIEAHTQARLGGNKPAETTGKALFALFRHDAARPDREEGLAAPNLHTHAFMFNMTKTKGGQIKPLQPLETYRTVKLSTAVYRAKLAEGLQKIGYEIQVDKRTGAPEIVGISREYIDRMSPRQKDIKEAAEVEREKGKLKGIVREDGTTSTRTVARRNRRDKVYDRDGMRALHQKIDREEFGGQAHRAVREAYAQTHELGAVLWDERESEARAKESVTYAIEKASEREAVNDTRALMVDALTRHMGAATLEDVTAEMMRRHERGELVGIVQTDEARRQVTTEKTLKKERKVTFPASQNPHLDYGYAVTSHSSQNQTVDRVLVHLDTRESDKLLNQLMAYVAASRMRSDDRIYTDLTRELSAALSRQVNKSTSLEATQRLPQSASPKGITIHEHERVSTTSRATQTTEIRETARTERILKNFDRERICRERIRMSAARTDATRAERAERSAGESRSLDRGTPFEGTLTTAGERGEQQGGHGRADQRFAARVLTDERTSGAKRAETRTVQAGRGQDDPSYSGGSGEGQVGAESPRVTRSVGGEERIAQTQPRQDEHYPTSAQRSGRDEAEGSFINADASRGVSEAYESSRDEELQRAALSTDIQPPVQDAKGESISAAVNAERLLGWSRGGNQVRDMRDWGGDRDNTSILIQHMDDPQSSNDICDNSDVRHDTDNRRSESGLDGIEGVCSNSITGWVAPNLFSDDWLHRREFLDGTGYGNEVGDGGRWHWALGESGTTTSLLDAAMFITSRPDENARMAEEVVRLANDNWLTTTGRELTQPVQDYMHNYLLDLAERPPTEVQIQNDRQIAQQLEHIEANRHENALQAALYAAQNAPNRSKMLSELTSEMESVAAAYQQQAMSEIEELPDACLQSQDEEEIEIGFSMDI